MPFCSNCGASNQGGKFCSACGKQVVASPAPAAPEVNTGITCAGCGKAVTTQYIDTVKAKFHPDCFKCHGCGKPIKGGYGYKEDNHPYCEACGGRKQGFTVDPRSGKKTYR